MGFWVNLFHDTDWDMSRYDYTTALNQIQPTVTNNILNFGIHNDALIDPAGNHLAIPAFLRIRLPRRYRDVHVIVRVEIPRAAATFNHPQQGWIEDVTQWFGITIRALSPRIWDSYLFYIRKQGSIEFGIHTIHEGNPVIGPPPEPGVSTRDVKIEIKAEDNRIQTWVNDGQRHNELDRDRRFVRSGDIYLISHGVLTRIHEVQIKIKKWYAPLIWVSMKLGKTLFWILFVAGGAAGLITMFHSIIRPIFGIKWRF